MKIKNLMEIYRIFSPSGNERKQSKYVQKKLKQMKIKFKVDKYNQVYCFDYVNKPLLSAHLDAVHRAPVKGLQITGDIISAQTNIGCDDKNGIFIILKMLSVNPNLNFIFSVEEEMGGKINTLDIESIKAPYCLVFDRKGNSDIIGTENSYCDIDLENNIKKLGTIYGYKPASGVYSDADYISEYIPSVNLSCGYYNAHSDNEYSLYSEIINCYNFAMHLINNLPDIPYKTAEKYNYYNDFKKNSFDEYNCPICKSIVYEDEIECFLCGEVLFFDDICPDCGNYFDDCENCENCKNIATQY